MSSMIERVAREMFSASWINYRDPDGNEEVSCGEKNWQLFEPLARAAIEEMRNPTDSMIESGAAGMCFTQDLGFSSICKFAWQDMIDAALKGG